MKKIGHLKPQNRKKMKLDITQKISDSLFAMGDHTQFDLWRNL